MDDYAADTCAISPTVFLLKTPTKREHLLTMNQFFIIESRSISSQNINITVFLENDANHMIQSWIIFSQWSAFDKNSDIVFLPPYCTLTVYSDGVLPIPKHAYQWPRDNYTQCSHEKTVTITMEQSLLLIEQVDATNFLP